MNIALIGASGHVGSALLTEALQRGHRVTALVSNPTRLAARDGLTVVAQDATDATALAERLRGLVRAYYLRGIRAIVAAAKRCALPRLLVVGGAASLEVAPGRILLDTPEFPAAWHETAAGARDALLLLRDEPALDWTMLSPSAHLAPGPRTGRFRLGTDQLLADANGKSHISLADYAVAMIDELEKPAHSRRRFTVGY